MLLWQGGGSTTSDNLLKGSKLTRQMPDSSRRSRQRGWRIVRQPFLREEGVHEAVRAARAAGPALAPTALPMRVFDETHVAAASRNFPNATATEDALSAFLGSDGGHRCLAFLWRSKDAGCDWPRRMSRDTDVKDVDGLQRDDFEPPLGTGDHWVVAQMPRATEVQRDQGNSVEVGDVNIKGADFKDSCSGNLTSSRRFAFEFMFLVLSYRFSVQCGPLGARFERQLSKPFAATGTIWYHQYPQI
eukprot:s4634_g6.t1